MTDEEVFGASVPTPQPPAQPKLLSDEEVFGTPTTPAVPSTSTKLLSDAEVFGTPTTPTTPTPTAPTPAPPQPPLAQRAEALTGATAEAITPSEFSKAFTGSLIGANPKMFGSATEGFGVLLDNQGVQDVGKTIAGYGEEQLKANVPRVPSYANIRSLQDVADYAEQQIGQAMGTSAPVAVTGLAVSALTRNPRLGLALGAATPSYIQNFGDVYSNVKEDKGIQERIARGELSPKGAAGISAIAAVPIAALDVMGLDQVLGKQLFGEAKRALVKRIAEGIGKGAIGEAGTEGLQEVLSQWTQHYLGSNTPMAQKVQSVIDNALGGFIGGGAMGGGAGIVQGKTGTVPAVPPTQDEIRAARDAVAGAEVDTVPDNLPIRTTFRWGMPEAGVAQQQASEMAAAVAAPTFYSPLLKAAEKLPSSGTTEQMLATLKNQPGVKDEEIEWTGLKDFLAGQEGKVSKEDLIAHLEENAVRIGEVARTDRVTQEQLDRMANHLFDAPFETLSVNERRQVETEIAMTDFGKARYGEYTLPGPREQYFELALTFPTDRSTAQVNVNQVNQELIDRYGGLTEAFNQWTPEEQRRWEAVNARATAEERRGTFISPHDFPTNTLAFVQATLREDINKVPTLFLDTVQSDWHQMGQKFGYRPELQAARAAAATAEREYIAAQDRYAAEPTETNLVAARNAHAAWQEAMDRRAREFPIAARVVPAAPFKTAWPELMLKRMIRYAADKGISRVAWIPGDKAFEVTTQGEGDAKQREGLRRFYDVILPSIAKKWAKRFGGSFGETMIPGEAAGDWVPLRSGGAWAVHSPIRRVVQPQFYMTEEEAAARANELNEKGGATRVMYIDVPPGAFRQIQQGLPMFSEMRPSEMEVEGSPEKKIGSLRVRYGRESPSISRKEKEKLAKIIQKLTDLLGVKDLELVFNGNRNFRALGKYSPGSHTIHVSTVYNRHAAEVYATAIHELGHAIQHTIWKNAPAGTKHAVQAAYDKYRAGLTTRTELRELLRIRDNPVLQMLNTRGMQQDTRALGMLAPEKREYWAGFDEWFVENVARWATTDELPLTIAERFFADLAATLKKMFKAAAQLLKIDYRANEALAGWLNSFIENHVPLATELEALEEKTRRENQEVLEQIDPALVAAPRQPEIAPMVANIQVAFGNAPPGGVSTGGQTATGGLPPAVRQGIAFADKMNAWLRYRAGLEHLIELNPRFRPLLEYGETNREMHLDTIRVIDMANRVMRDWRHQGKQGENITRMVDDLMNMRFRTADEISRGIERNPTLQEFRDLVQQHGLTGGSVRVVQRITESFKAFLLAMEQNAIEHAQRTIDNPMALANTIDQIRQQTQNLLKKPYFPAYRFGMHYITVRDAAGKTVHFETVERRGFKSAERVQAGREQELRQQFGPDHSYEIGILPETAEPFIGLPPLMLEAIARELNLTPAQRDAIQQLQYELSPAASFKKRMMHKAYTPGYSMDFKRAYARYFFSGARYYARTKHAWKMREQIAAAGNVGGLKADKIANYMRDHFNHNVVDAKHDFGILKGIAFQWILAFNAASAALNLTQVPLITWPFLGAKFGHGRAEAAITKAYFDVKNFYKKETYTGLRQFEMQALNYGIKTGRISETQATELAGLAQAHNLAAAFGGTKAQEALIKYLEASAWMFETAEQINRRVTFRATLELAQKYPNAKVVDQAVNKHVDEYNTLRQQGFTEAQARAIVTAAYAVDQTQYNYARYARPRFMRGPISGAVLVFFRYIESTLALLSAHRGDVLPRFLILMLLLAGPYGMPGAEDLNDLIRALAYRMFGKDFDPKKKLRQLIIDLSGDKIPPDLILHGIARYGFGIPAVVDWAGGLFTGRPGRGLQPAARAPGQNVPMPVIDMSRSIGMGQIMRPNIGKLLMPGTDTGKLFEDQARTAGGALVGSAMDIVKALRSTDSYADFKNWERAVPRYLGNVSKAFRTYSEERTRSRGGVQSAPTVLQYDPRDTEHMMELFSMGLGFRTQREAGQWDRIMAEQDQNNFYDLQHKALMSQLFEAKYAAEPAEWDRVRKAIDEYNDSLPDWARGKAITREGIRQSLQARERERVAKESGFPAKRTSRGVSEYIQGLFPESTIDVRRVK